MLSFFRNVRRKPLRFSLTFLQIFLGSLAMTLALSPLLTPKNTRNEDTFFINYGYKDEQGMLSVYSIFAPYDLERLQALTPDIEHLLMYQSDWDSANIVYEGKRFAFQTGAVVSVGLEYFQVSPLTITSGDVFSSQDEQGQNAVVLLSDSVAKKIFGDADPIGQTLLKVPSSNFYNQQLDNLGPVPYRVVGTFADTKNTLLTPPGILFPAWSPGSFFYKTSSYQLLVKARPGKAEVAKEQILAAARQHYKNDTQVLVAQPGEDFFISSFADLTDGETPFNPNLIILGLFGIISLVIGSIGLFSTMLVEVLGRSYDIGVKRALGASRFDICKEFATESASLAFFGGVSGIAVSVLLISQLAGPLGETFFYGLEFVWQPLAAFLVLTVTVLLGSLLGFFPALRATWAKPVEALREI